MSFSELGLAAGLLRAVETEGYTEPTEIQRQAIPLVLAGRDVLASARTGTGKTAAFILPLLHRFEARARDRKDRRPVVLVLTPTRELAAQIADSARAYGRHLPLRTTTVYGGVGIRPQIDALRAGVDIVVATPGRLLDHMEQRTIDLAAIETVVLDEADRMLDMGFIRDIRRILGRLPVPRQTLMFSATFSKEIRALADDFLDQPLEVAAAPRNAAAERAEQLVYHVDKSRKRELVSWLIGSGNWRQVLVFTRTKHGADRLARQLEQDGLRATAIHGRKTQGARTRALEGFKAGQIRVLVATDIAARGLDIERLPHVVNYELPAVPEDYVHRIGRTARAGEDGQAISLVAPDERKQLAAIERLLGSSLRCETPAGYQTGRPSPAARPAPARASAPGDQAQSRERSGDARPPGKRRRKSRRRGGITAPKNRSGNGDRAR